MVSVCVHASSPSSNLVCACRSADACRIHVDVPTGIVYCVRVSTTALGTVVPKPPHTAGMPACHVDKAGNIHTDLTTEHWDCCRACWCDIHGGSG